MADVSGPDERNYGFWTEVDGAGVYLSDQGAECIAKAEFEKRTILGGRRATASLKILFASVWLVRNQ